MNLLSLLQSPRHLLGSATTGSLVIVAACSGSASSQGTHAAATPGDDGGVSTEPSSGSDAGADTAASTEDSGTAPSTGNDSGTASTPVDAAECGAKGSEVVLIGDSYFALSEPTSPPAGEITEHLQSLATAAGALAQGDTYRHYYMSGANMATTYTASTVTPIPKQFASAVSANPDIKYVIMDGGGNDILLENTACITASATSAISATCKAAVQGALDAATALFQSMKTAGVREGDLLLLSPPSDDAVSVGQHHARLRVPARAGGVSGLAGPLRVHRHAQRLQRKRRELHRPRRHPSHQRRVRRDCGPHLEHDAAGVRRAFPVMRSLPLPLLVSLAACSASSGSSGPVVTQTGKTVSYTPCSAPTPVAGATVNVGSHTATTAADGSYTIEVPSGVPFTMTVTAPDYIPLTEAEDTVQASYDWGNTLLISTETAMFLEGALTGFDPKMSLLTIELVKTGACTDVTGTTVTVSSPGASAVTEYPAQCASPVGGASATDGTFPSASDAVVYNLIPGAHTVTATSPKCTQVPYPYTDPATGLTYDGTVTTQAGNANAFRSAVLNPSMRLNSPLVRSSTSTLPVSPTGTEMRSRACSYAM